MIKSFADRGTEKLWIPGRTRHLPGDLWQRALWQRALVRLQLIDAAVELAFLKPPPGHHLEALKGNRCGQYSIRINDQWRTCFRWSGTDAEQVEIIDYH